MTRSLRPYIISAVVLLALQAGFIFAARDRLPDLGVVPTLASEEELKLLSFGDGQLLFRIMTFRLNNTGDTFGRFTSLREYNLERVYHWFSRLDHFDNTSDHPAAMSAYYFSQSQNTEDIIHMVNYLYEHSKDRPEEKWWWLTQATYIAMHKLKNNELALEIAKHLEGVSGIPYWAQQMPAFVHEQRGEFEAAYEIMKAILAEDDKLTQGELNYMRYFMEERVKRLEEVEALFEQQQKRIDENPSPLDVSVEPLTR